MKLKYERFEGLSCFSVRGEIKPFELKILQVGLESLVKAMDATLVVNLSLAIIPESMVAELLAFKKTVVPPEKIKTHWISPVKNLGEFPSLPPFTSRLNGAKYRQIGERLVLDDEIYKLHEKMLAEQVTMEALLGDEDKAHAMILQNRILKEQERILKETIHFQRERMKLQNTIPSVNSELPTKMTEARSEVKRIFGKEVDV